MPQPRVLYWFRTDLRLHDSPALKAALDLNPSALYPIWCWDPHYVYHARVGPNRWQFLLDCMNDLSASITKLNSKTPTARGSGERDINGKYREVEEKSYTSLIAGPDGKFGVPTLEELGMQPATSPIRGGESVILSRLEKILADEEYTGTFEKPETSPAAF
ncbi:hypothetical protein LTR17_021333 [Elasticomyces elasticus]|nr:hypothetical protein LTR17_021333 [Elasticomyces elasticus]